MKHCFFHPTFRSPKRDDRDEPMSEDSEPDEKSFVGPRDGRKDGGDARCQAGESVPRGGHKKPEVT